MSVSQAGVFTTTTAWAVSVYQRMGRNESESLWDKEKKKIVGPTFFVTGENLSFSSEWAMAVDLTSSPRSID